MIDYQTFCQIRFLHDQKKLSVSQIAAELQLSPLTVAKWVKIPTFQQRKSPKRSSKLDPFKGQIVAMLERHAYTAQQILQQIRTDGYAGAYSILKDFVRQVRPVYKPAFLKLEFAAAEAAQVDWGSYGSVQVGSTRRRLSFFVMVLCYSRLMYVEFTLGETMEQFLSCFVNAFAFIGGIPKRIIIDNLKVGVLRHLFGDKAQFNPRFLDFAARHAFEPVACNVRKANEKGRVENGVGYVKKNFLNGLEIPSFPAIHLAARHWLDSVANVRIHGETNRKPLELFDQEKLLLTPLPLMPYDCAVIKPVSSNGCCRVRFEANRYSVPYLYASQKLTLKIYPQQLFLFHNEKLIATHARSYERRKDVFNPDHNTELLIQRKRAHDQTLLLAFLNLSPQAELYARKMQQKCLNAPHHIEKIVALSQIFGPDKMVLAFQDAIKFEAYGCEYIANILHQRERTATTPTALHLTRRQDLLDLDIPAADLSPYEAKQQKDSTNPL
jgi:transposase